MRADTRVDPRSCSLPSRSLLPAAPRPGTWTATPARRRPGCREAARADRPRQTGCHAGTTVPAAAAGPGRRLLRKKSKKQKPIPVQRAGLAPLGKARRSLGPSRAHGCGARPAPAQGTASVGTKGAFSPGQGNGWLHLGQRGTWSRRALPADPAGELGWRRPGTRSASPSPRQWSWPQLRIKRG